MTDVDEVRLPLNPGTDGVSRNVYGLIFNGLTRATAGDNFMLLSERERVTRVIYDELRDAGVAVRFTGLDQLREVHDQIVAARRGDPHNCTCHHGCDIP